MQKEDTFATDVNNVSIEVNEILDALTLEEQQHFKLAIETDFRKETKNGVVTVDYTGCLDNFRILTDILLKLAKEWDEESGGFLKIASFCRRNNVSTENNIKGIILEILTKKIEKR
jgi:hypothetical protein